MRTLTIVVLALSLSGVGSGKEPAKKEKPGPQGVLLVVPGYIISEGDEVQLFCSDAKGRLLDVGVAEDVSTFSELQKAIVANDTEGLHKLIKVDKSVSLLPSGTRVRVLELPAFAPPRNRLSDEPEYRHVEIRILDGPKKGETGYAIYEYVRKCQMVYPKAKRKPRR